MNISTPVDSMHLLIPFHDFFNLKTCLASSGRRGSVGAGGGGSGMQPSAITSHIQLLLYYRPRLDFDLF
jgi:hypothetical protein